MQEILLKIRYLERGLSKRLSKLTLFFLSNPVPLTDKVIKNKRGLELGNSCSSDCKISSKKLFIYFLTKFDDKISSGFRVIPKITSANLCKPIHDIINCSTSICPFESGKCGKEGKNYKSFNISRTKKA